MRRSTINPRCKCCDEVMEELLTMRQTFEKLLHRLTNQVVDLRREVAEALENSTQQSSKVETTASRKTPIESSFCPEPAARKPKFCNESESEVEMVQTTVDFSNNSSDNELMKPMIACSTNRYATSQKLYSDSKDSIQFENMKTVSQPVTTFFKVKGRVLPKKPFTDSQQFDDWNEILQNDEDQRDKLRAELLKGVFDEPDKYIKHIWRNLLKNEAAEHYSYRGNGRCKKKAIKNYIFTDIFIECFLQRFHHMDHAFFTERTMRFFNYAHDNMRKLERDRKKQQMKNSMNDVTMDEPSIDDLA